MYDYIKGTLTHIRPINLTIEASGVGYQLMCANPYRWQEQLHQEVTCPVVLIVREDAMQLYGFKDETEKNLFTTLLKVSGIGPKSALSILALDDHQGLIQAIDAGDSKYLTKFPGVGKKTAQQMILDLKGSLDFVETDDVKQIVHATQNAILEETYLALQGLGYSTKEISKIEATLQQGNHVNTQSALSAAFKLLRK